LKEFTDLFEIKPSSAKVGANLSNTGSIISFTTPKIMKRGATSPKDTLLAIYNFIHRVYEIYEEFSGVTPDITPVLNTTITLVPKENIKITINGTEVESIRFRDIPNIEIEVPK